MSSQVPPSGRVQLTAADRIAALEEQVAELQKSLYDKEEGLQTWQNVMLAIFTRLYGANRKVWLLMEDDPQGNTDDDGKVIRVPKLPPGTMISFMYAMCKGQADKAKQQAALQQAEGTSMADLASQSLASSARHAANNANKRPRLNAPTGAPAQRGDGHIVGAQAPAAPAQAGASVISQE